MLPNEEEHDDLETLLRESCAASEPPAEFVEQLHERLQAELATLHGVQVGGGGDVGREREARNVWNHVSRWIGGLTMRQRIAALGGMGVAAVLGLVLLWGAMDTRPVSAMEKMAESVRRAKSCKMTGTSRTVFHNGDSPEVAREGKSIVYWLAPGSFRTELFDVGEGGSERPRATYIMPGEKQAGIVISHRTKSYHVHPSGYEEWRRSVTPDMLADFAGMAEGDLGSKEVAGRKLWGFAVQSEKVIPNASAPGLVEIWIDSETSLPVSMRSETKGETHTTIDETTGIQWNVNLDGGLFDITPPIGYKDLTWNARNSGNPVQSIVEAFRPYLGVPNGTHPEMNEKPTVQDVENQLLVVDTILSNLEAGKLDIEESVAKHMLGNLPKQREGFLYLREIVRENRDVIYYGQGLKTEEKDKVLLRWRLDDGRYQVIFTNLSDEVVTAERLGVLEQK